MKKLLLFAFAACALAACSDDDGDSRVPATAVVLDCTEKELAVGETLQLTATPAPANTTDDVVWSSDAEEFATVSESGLVTAVAAGTAKISATYGSVSATCTVHVSEPDPEPDPEPTADWYVHGATTDPDNWGPTAMESASGNIKAYKAAGIEVVANVGFVFKSGDESQWIGADASLAGDNGKYACVIGSAFQVSANKVDAVIAEAGTYDYWLLPDDGRAYVMTAGVKPEYVAETWGLVGNITGWGDLGDFSMTEDGAYFVRKGVALTTTSEFKVRFNNTWDDAKNYGTENGGAIDINTAVSVITSGGSQNMKVQIDGTYDIYFDLANAALYVMDAGKTPADAQ